jgi:hypothetical protein
MARQQDVLWVRRSEAETRAVCARALAELGLRPGAGSATALVGREPLAAGWHWPVTLRLAFAPTGEGVTRVVVEGTAFGLGPIQAGNLRRRLAAFRAAVARAAPLVVPESAPSAEA